MTDFYPHIEKIKKPEGLPKPVEKILHVSTPESEEKNRIINEIESLTDKSWSIENWYERRIDVEEIVDLFHQDEFSKEVKPTIRRLDTYANKYLQYSTELKEMGVLRLEQQGTCSYLKREYEKAKSSLDEAMNLEKAALEYSSGGSDVDAYREFILDHGILDLDTGKRGKEEISRRHEYEDAKSELDNTNDEINRLSVEMRKLAADHMSNVRILHSCLYRFCKQLQSSHEVQQRAQQSNQLNVSDSKNSLRPRNSLYNI